MFKRTPVNLSDEEKIHFDNLKKINCDMVNNQYQDIKTTIKTIDGYDVEFPAHRFDNDYLTDYTPNYPKWIASKINEDILSHLPYLKKYGDDNFSRDCYVENKHFRYELNYNYMLVSAKFRDCIKNNIKKIEINDNISHDAFHIVVCYLHLLDGIEIAYVPDMDYFYENPNPLSYNDMKEIIPNNILNLLMSCDKKMIDKIIDIADELEIVSLKYIACSIFVYKVNNNTKINDYDYDYDYDGIIIRYNSQGNYENRLREQIKKLNRDENKELIDTFVNDISN